VLALASLCTTAQRRYFYEVAPPPAIEDAASAIYHNEKYAAGDALVLRGLLALTEDLELRLRSELIRASVDELQGDRPLPHELDTDMWLDDDDADAAVLDGWEAPDGDDRTHVAMTKAHNLAYDKSADAAAAAYVARQQNVSVPVLPGGGVRSAKVTSQHLLLINQLKMLLRHTVRAFPIGSGGASTNGSPETLTA